MRARLVVIAIGLGLVAAAVFVHPHARPLEPGILLVARPDATDAIFDGTVVLILEVGNDGSGGVILNRTSAPEGFTVRDGFRFGGPVTGTRIHLQRSGAGFRSRTLPDDAPVPAEGLAFDGIARWSPGQLEEEIHAGSWWVSRLPAEVLFGSPADLWWKASADFH